MLTVQVDIAAINRNPEEFPTEGPATLYVHTDEERALNLVVKRHLSIYL